MTATPLRSTATDAREVFASLGIPFPSAPAAGAEAIDVCSPIDGSMLATLGATDRAGVDAAVAAATAAFVAWRAVPAPRRGELVRRFADEVRAHQDALGLLVTLETGKIRSEGVGEIQEVVDMCDLAVGLSRQLYGRTMPSERPGHRLVETWHPLGPIGVITAFNFPAAVWAWNAAVALVCGDPVVWKPSERTPLTALACVGLLERAGAGLDGVPPGLASVVLGGVAVGEQLADDERLPLISATGSTAMGRALGPRVAARFGRSLLELGGNNAAIVTPSADLDLTVRAVTFAAAGTAGQRCTTLRRLIVHRSVVDEVVDRVGRAFGQLRVGDPRDAETLVGPLVDETAVVRMRHALDEARDGGAQVIGGELVDAVEGGWYVRPALVVVDEPLEITRRETFAPILTVFPYDHLDEAIALNNEVEHGLSSAIFTGDVREAERFLGPAGSDCGIANVNTGPSGAEIGGAFGGEKATGGGREAGSDSWKAYLRRSTATVNGSAELPLAQGVSFT